MESKDTQNTGKRNERQINTKQYDKSCITQFNLYENRKQGKTLSNTIVLLQIAQPKDASMQSYPWET